MKGKMVLLTGLFPVWACGQNLLPNGDFEQYTLCPDYVSQIDRATGWSRPTNGTSDYLNACLGVPFSMNVPDNQFGDEPAHSGNGYAGFYCFYEAAPFTTVGDGYREYVTHALASPLVPGRTYSVEFHVSLADVSKYAVNDIGALFSVQAPYRADELAIAAAPQVTHGGQSWLDDKNGWTTIIGCFVADSAYQYLTIGNFHDGASTAFQQMPTQYPLTYYSYYYVDDVSVAELERPDLGPDTSTCTTVLLNVLSPLPGVTYTWSNGATGNSLPVQESGVYWVSANMNGCVVADTIAVQLLDPLLVQLPTDTTVDFCSTSHIALSIDSVAPDASFLWSNGASGAAITVEVPGTYSVSLSAPGHCPANASVQVIDACATAVHAPNAFTPNGDGINDIWRPEWMANNGATLTVSVFDRWGTLLYAAEAPSIGWDGTANGVELPIGVYAWRGHAQDRATHVDRIVQGHIALVR